MVNQSSKFGSPTDYRVIRRLMSLPITSALIVGALLFPMVGSADNSDLIKGNRSVTMPSPPPQNNNTDAPVNCTQPNRDARCRPTIPEYRPYPYYRRPIIVNSVPAPTPIDINSLKDDWEGCRSTKISAINSRSAGNLDQANRLDEWLWKNCRSYSEELRDLE